MSTKKASLVLDANAFIHQIDLRRLLDTYQFVSTYDAMAEVKDQTAREKLRLFSEHIVYMDPSESSITFIKRFATSTGDISTLSFTDINLLGLAYNLAEQNGKLNLLHKQPAKPIYFKKVRPQWKTNPTVVEADEDSDGWQTVEDPRQKPIKGPTSIETEEPTQEPQLNNNEAIQSAEEHPEIMEKDEASESEGDEDDWVTCDNIQNHITGLEHISKDDAVDENILGVAVLTADYAMQNVLLQLGVPIISQEGYRVLQARRFILECHICKQLIRDSSKLFCPGCGNNSLLKVSCSISSDGEIVLYRKRNFKVNNRGTQFCIPKHQEKTHDQLIIREDQLMMGGIQQKLKREQIQADKMYKKMMLSYENGFGFDDVDLKQSRGKAKIKVGYGRLNPNDVQDMKKIKSKRHK